jgi:DNA-binding response OmpR family regulator
VTLSKKLNPNRPVFVVSSLGSETEIVEEALAQGANEVLTKPIAFEDIAEKIRNVLLLEAV